MSWVAPGADALFDALDATWPAAGTQALGGWTLRRGDGGGQRVSSVRAVGEPGMALRDAVAAAEAAMRAWGQPPLFQIEPKDGALDAALSALGYRVLSPCPFMAASSDALAGPGWGRRMVVRVRSPLAALDEMWGAGGIGPARRAVMARAPAPKETLTLREDDRIAAAAFVGAHRGVAVMHALHVAPTFRKRGLGRAMVAACAAFAAENGAPTLAFPVEAANAGALALYGGLGMIEVSRYHYRAAPEDAAT
ncbi:GNAT family N-acetyltransferase [Rubrimonas cliftonensis]|uniref:Acetyltransferase (GNAT) family protein n=1 Tax=Rubrimonas cliftonensis TaxID=89524 RepID=A0A1H4G951_9RHOB|nr:GNAT family N-acetyltransferase [Rubrimonas cliftonensis]SEB06146.1 Acetyltransferase (GNAT) family protein [Rubrimonas cliftonensis]